MFFLIGCPVIINDENFSDLNHVEQLLDYVFPKDGNSTQLPGGAGGVSPEFISRTGTLELDPLNEDLYALTIPQFLKKRRENLDPDLVGMNTIELTYWDLVYTEFLSDILINYFFDRANCIKDKFVKSIDSIEMSSIYGVVSGKSLDSGIEKTHFGKYVKNFLAKNTVETDLPSKLRHIPIRLSGSGETQCYYRLIPRHPLISGANSSLLSSDSGKDACVFRFRVSSIETPLVIRLGKFFVTL